MLPALALCGASSGFFPAASRVGPCLVPQCARPTRVHLVGSIEQEPAEAQVQVGAEATSVAEVLEPKDVEPVVDRRMEEAVDWEEMVSKVVKETKLFFNENEEWKSTTARLKEASQGLFAGLKEGAGVLEKSITEAAEEIGPLAEELGDVVYSTLTAPEVASDDDIEDIGQEGRVPVLRRRLGRILVLLGFSLLVATLLRANVLPPPVSSATIAAGNSALRVSRAAGAAAMVGLSSATSSFHSLAASTVNGLNAAATGLASSAQGDMASAMGTVRPAAHSVGSGLKARGSAAVDALRPMIDGVQGASAAAAAAALTKVGAAGAAAGTYTSAAATAAAAKTTAAAATVHTTALPMIHGVQALSSAARAATLPKASAAATAAGTYASAAATKVNAAAAAAHATALPVLTGVQALSSAVAAATMPKVSAAAAALKFYALAAAAAAKLGAAKAGAFAAAKGAAAGAYATKVQGALGAGAAAFRVAMAA